MPMVIPALAAVVASWASTAVGGYLVAAGVTNAFAIAAAKFFVAFAVSAVAAALFNKKPAAPGDQGRLETLRAPVAARRVIYGQARVGTQVVYGQTSGDHNKFVHVIGVLGHGEIESISPYFWVGEKLNTNKQFDSTASQLVDDTVVTPVAPRIHVEYRLGTADQAAVSIPEVAWEWTAAHRLQGIAYVYQRYEHDPDGKAFPNGIPSPNFLVKGRKLYDPRDGVTRWSDNAALVILDYLRSQDYGIGCADSLIDFDAFRHAADVCDQVVPCFDPLRPGESVKRYTINGVVSLDASPASILETMETACAGQLVFSGGRYRLYVGEYVTPTVTIDERWLRGDPTIRVAPSRAQAFNTVHGSFVDPMQDWQETDFPPLVNQQQLAQDGTEVVHTVSFPLTTSCATAQRLAKIELFRQQAASTLTLPLNWMGLDLDLWQVVRVGGFAPLSDRVYRVVEWSLAQGGGVDVTLQEECEEMYEWSHFADETIPQRKSSSPVVADYPVIEDLEVGKVANSSDATARWSLPRGWPVAPQNYDVQVADSSGVFVHVATTVYTEHTLTLPSEVAVIRVRARDANGLVGAWAYIRADRATGTTTVIRRPTADGLNVRVTPVMHGVEVKWDDHPQAQDGYDLAVRPADSPTWTYYYVGNSSNNPEVVTVGESANANPPTGWRDDGSQPDSKTFGLSGIWSAGITARVRARSWGTYGYWSPSFSAYPMSKDMVFGYGPESYKGYPTPPMPDAGGTTGIQLDYNYRSTDGA